MLAAAPLSAAQPTVGLVLKRGAPRARDVARSVVASLAERGIGVISEPEDASSLGVGTAEKAEMFAIAQAIVVLGGDGTFLATARHAGERAVPIVGVNLGGLGFLTEITGEDLAATLAEALSGRAAIENRRMLRAVVRRAGGGEESYQALNDAVLARGAQGHVVDVDARIDGAYLASFKGDGVIVATPTGSTAYALSAGGPIVHPTVRVFVLAPICPHTLSVRPLVIDDGARLELCVRSRREALFLTLDGQETVPIEPDDAVEVARSPHAAHLVRSPKLSFFDLLRSKLGWAALP
jgi:NAD+ kinase